MPICHKKILAIQESIQTLKTIERIVQFIISMSCCITIAGGVTLNPVELGTIFGAGVLLKTFSEYKIIRKKSSSGYWYILVF